MKTKSQKAILLLPVLMVLGLLAGRAQQAATKQANNFTSIEYFEPPHQMLMRTRLSGAQAQPLTNGLLLIQQLRLETFDSNGVPSLIVKAPHCVYDTVHGLASSPGHLRLESPDGSSHVEGDGFLWRQTNSFLTISNNVQTVIETDSKKQAGS